MEIGKIRKKFIDFFKERGHVEIASAPIVPLNDATTLFIGSGMQPLLPYLLGEKHPLGNRIVDSQKCFRAEDIEDVGDNRHTTFFEMLGNWSFGDYWKEEQLSWYFEFLVKEVGLDPEKIYVTCFIGDEKFDIPKDEESASIWKRLFSSVGIEAKVVDIGSEQDGYVKGMSDGRIFYYDASKNWWSRSGIPSAMPVGEPGGPDSEVFYDFGTPHDTKYGEHCHVNCDCGRFIELGNSVFMEFLKTDDGFERLKQRNVDHGSGLMRIAVASAGVSDVFLVDAFEKARKIIEEVSDKKYEAFKSDFRIVMDHIRASVFMLADGVLPSNKEAGYVLRRLIRRASMAMRRLGAPSEALVNVAESFYEYYEKSYGFPKIEDIAEPIKKEIESFARAVEKGVKEIERGNRDAFGLYATYGLPKELIIEMAREKNIEIDMSDFDEKVAKHKELSRSQSAGKFKGGLADASEEVVKLHTAHHLLLSALKKVVSQDIHQRGSNITKERLRMDFAFDRKLTDEEKRKVEELVNGWIDEGLPVLRKEMPLGEAKKIGAEMEFMVKYPETVTVYFIGDEGAGYVSKEFCGGPHVKNTKELGKFRIKKEESSSRGVRRIKAVLE